jgi:hypothetical protein
MNSFEEQEEPAVDNAPALLDEDTVESVWIPPP